MKGTFGFIGAGTKGAIGPPSVIFAVVFESETTVIFVFEGFLIFPQFFGNHLGNLGNYLGNLGNHLGNHHLQVHRSIGFENIGSFSLFFVFCESFFAKNEIFRQ